MKNKTSGYFVADAQGKGLEWASTKEIKSNFYYGKVVTIFATRAAARKRISQAYRQHIGEDIPENLRGLKIVRCVEIIESEKL